MGEYVPKQSTAASATNLALGIDENGKLGFFPQEEGTYMAANTAWLNVASLGASKDQIVVYLDIEPEVVVPEVVHGDSDGDGELGINDVSFLIDYMLTTGIDAAIGADVDGNGEINISDIALLIDLILTGN